MATKKIQILGSSIFQSGVIVHTVLRSKDWHGDGPYSQSIELANVDVNSKIDIQADINTLKAVHDREYKLCIANNNGTIIAHVIGNKPTIDLNIQLLITTVKKSHPNEIVWGNVLI